MQDKHFISKSRIWSYLFSFLLHEENKTTELWDVNSQVIKLQVRTQNYKKKNIWIVRK